MKHEIVLRLSPEESIELYISMIDMIRNDTERRLPAEVYEIVGRLQGRLSEFEIEEVIRVNGFLTCAKCQTSGFTGKQSLVRHIQTCYGVSLDRALVIIHNLFRPVLILRGR